MKIILVKDTPKLGRAGALVEVSGGYARNFLIPKGFAVEATPGKTAEWRAEQARLKAVDDNDRKAALDMQRVLEGKSVTIAGKAGDNGKLFGSITPAQIAEALGAQHNLDGIGKRNIKLDEAVKSAGSYKFSVKLYPNIQADMTLIVTAAE